MNTFKKYCPSIGSVNRMTDKELQEIKDRLLRPYMLIDIKKIIDEIDRRAKESIGNGEDWRNRNE